MDIYEIFLVAKELHRKRAKRPGVENRQIYQKEPKMALAHAVHTCDGSVRRTRTIEGNVGGERVDRR